MRLAIHLFVLIMWALGESAIRVLPRQESAYLLQFFRLYCLWVVFSHCILKLLYEASFLMCDIQQTFLIDFYWNPTKMWKINLGFSSTEKVSSITLVNVKMCFLSPTNWWTHNLDIFNLYEIHPGPLSWMATNYWMLEPFIIRAWSQFPPGWMKIY